MSWPASRRPENSQQPFWVFLGFWVSLVRDAAARGECVCRWCVCQSSREGDDEAALPLVAPVWRVAHTVLWLSRELGSLECDDGHWAGHLTGEDKKGRGSK